MSDVLNDLLKMLAGDASSAADRELLAMHDAVDFALVAKLATCVKDHAATLPSQPSVGLVCSSLAFTLATCLADGSPSDHAVCVMSEKYGEYLHRVAHSVWRTDNQKPPGTTTQ